MCLQVCGDEEGGGGGGGRGGWLKADMYVSLCHICYT